MTAEVVILNRNGVALAADSAATVDYAGNPKIHNSANKLFTLSKYEPVGIMINGTSSIMDVPWEIIVKAYRAKLGKTSFDHIKDYVDDFIKFVVTFFTEEQQSTNYIRNVYWIYKQIFSQIDEQIKDRFEEGTVNDNEVAAIVSDFISQIHSNVASLQDLPNITNEFISDLRQTFLPKIFEVKESIFKSIPINDETLQHLIDIAMFIAIKNDFSSSTGIVITGYGEKELFPSLCTFQIDFVVCNQAKHILHPPFCVCDESPQSIYAFAQTDMVIGFVEGVDPFYREGVEEYLQELLSMLSGEIADVIPTISDQEKADLKSSLSNLTDQVYNQFVANCENLRRAHTQNITQEVNFLEKDELAAMAESLVSLTSFKRKVTMDPGTVGGPVDVAVISKFDGFIWIKRKHYFDPELNPRFIQNYFNTRIKENDNGNE